MCGVIGYVGPGADPELFYMGLKRLEYRGYDSAGIAMLTRERQIEIQRAEGKLSELRKKLGKLPHEAVVGIGHTRWATHGKPVEVNAHPHRSGNLALLHNGIIENYREIKAFLIEHHYEFSSETDTEVAAHFIHWHYSQEKGTDAAENMKQAILKSVPQLKGAYAFGIVCSDILDKVFTVKFGSPLVLGRGEKENFFASGVTALIDHTNDVAFLEDGQIAILGAQEIEVLDFQGKPSQVSFSRVDWSVSMMEKGGYRHFMLKEIHEQPQAVAQTLQGRINLETGQVDKKSFGIENLDLNEIENIHIVACGTSSYAGNLGKSFIEEFGRVPVEVTLASEYRYRTCLAHQKTLVVAISQSGETVDTLWSVKYAKQHGAKVLAIVNNPGSSIAHVADWESLTHAGPEIGVASTKAFSAQITSLYILALAFAQERKTLSEARYQEAVESLIKVPSLVEKCLSLSATIEEISKDYLHLPAVLFIGRKLQWPVAMEGALKLKELSYIQSEAYAGGELKHGPIALIDDEMHVLALALRDSTYDKTLSNIEEIRSRGGKVLAIASEGDTSIQEVVDKVIYVPHCEEWIQPFISVIPLHLFSYWVAVGKGTDVDQPRNLAKSVTVE